MRRVRFGLVLVALCFWINTVAQVPELSFNRLPGGRDLTSQYVTSVTQDHYGYMWIGTRDGVNRYDGYEVRTYRSLSQNNPAEGVIGNIVEHMVVDGNNRVWASTTHGLARFNWLSDRFEVVVSDKNLRGLPGPFLEYLYTTPDGSLVAVCDNSIYRYDDDTESFRLLYSSPLGLISVILVDSNGQWWIGHQYGKGIIHLPDINFPLDYKWFQSELFGGKTEYSVLAIAESDGSVWVALESSGLARIQLNSKLVRRYFETGDERFFFYLFTDKAGRLWACEYNGIKVRLPGMESFLSYSNKLSEPGSLSGGLLGVYVDNLKNVFTYHNGGGVNVSYWNRGFYTIRASGDYLWHTTRPNITALSYDRNGNLWLGNNDGGIDIFSISEAKKLRIDFRDGDRRALGRGSVQALFRDSKGQMWVGTDAGGLHRYNEKTRDFDVWRQGLTPTAPTVNDVRSIVEDRKGNLWIGLYGGGIDMFNPQTGTFINYNIVNTGLSSMWVYKLLFDREGNLWVGTANGLSLLRQGADAFEVFYSDEEAEKGLRANQFLSLLQDRRGRLWLGTNNGLYVMDSDVNMRLYPNEMAGQSIMSIEEDGEGNLWISTLNGIYSLDPETGVFHAFDETDGLDGLGFNNNASLYDDAGIMYFAGPHGVTNFNPLNIEYNLRPPTLRFTRLRLFNEPVTEYGNGKLLPCELNYLDKLVLTYDHKFFSIEFAALSLSNPDNNKYMCKLEGFDEEWIQLGNTHSVSYTNLYPGEYVLKIQAANNDGVWNEEGLSLPIIILAPWWMTWWAVILYVLSVIFLVYLILKRRTLALERQKLELESMVSEQTIRLRMQNESLKRRSDALEEANKLLVDRRMLIAEQAQKLEEQAEALRLTNEQLMKHIQTKDRLYSLVAHDLRGPFNTIMGFASLLSDAGEDEDKEKVRTFARFINDASVQVFNLLENLLFWAHSQSDEIKCLPSKIKLDGVVRETIDLLSDSALKKRIAIYEQVDPEVLVYADSNMLRTILRNLLMNAIKFTEPGGEVFVEAKINGKMVSVCVVDTGVGMDGDTLQRIQNESDISRVGTGGEKGSGLGLLLCRDFVHRNGGTLEISSTLGKGSRFCFTLPIPD